MRRLERTIGDVGWTRDVPWLDSAAPVARAAELMRRYAHECVLVTSGRELAGIFTSRDHLNRVVAAGGDAARLPLAAVMTPRPHTLRPRDPVAFAINWMAVEGFRNVPIVDDSGELLGVLTVWDVMRCLSAIFDEIDATPREVAAAADISGVVDTVDLGGGS